MENRSGSVPNAPDERGLGRILLDTISETVLSLVVFLFAFAAWMLRWSVAVVLFLALMAAAGYYVFYEVLEGGAQVQVPDVTQRTITEASFMLAEQGLEVGKQQHVVDERVPKYYVIGQRPTPGKVVRTGRKISLTVSAGSESLSPPNFVGALLTKAAEDLNRSAFALGTVARIPHAARRDTVIAQDPTPDRLVGNNTRINLLVSDGQPLRAFVMPDLVGKSLQQMLAAITPLGLRPVPRYIDTPDERSDVVLAQEPAAGTLCHEGDRLLYSVHASGTVELPDAQRSTQKLSYTVPASWFEREVRVDKIDRDGARATVFPLEKHYVGGQPPKFASGSTLEISPFKYIDNALVEIYLDGQLARSYYYEGDAEPETTDYNLQ